MRTLWSIRSPLMAGALVALASTSLHAQELTVGQSWRIP